MLTVKEPLKITLSANIINMQLSLGDKILQNYEAMISKADSNELLHLLTGAPLQEPNINHQSIFNNNISAQITELNARVINNVVNRILADGTSSFSYQDTVYITSILNKLGINDVNSFMLQIRQAVNNDIKLQAYQSSVEAQALAVKKSKRKAPPKHSNNKQLPQPQAQAADFKENYLFSKVYSRLNTEKIYNLIAEFNKAGNNSYSNINASQLNLAEQIRVSKMLKISQNFESSSHLFLDLRHTNLYEDMPLIEQASKHTTVMPAAEAPVGAITNNYTFLNKTANNKTTHNTGTKSTNMSSVTESTMLFAESSEADYVQNNILWQTAAASLLNLIANTVTVLNTMSKSQKSLSADITNALNSNVNNSIMRLAYNVESSYENAEYILNTQPSQSLTLEEELQLINQKNIAMYNKLSEIQAQQTNIENKTVADKAKTIRQSLIALENPNNILSEIQQASEPAKISYNSQVQAILNSADNQTKEFYENILQLEKASAPLTYRPAAQQEALQQMLTDIAAASSALPAQNAKNYADTARQHFDAQMHDAVSMVHKETAFSEAVQIEENRFAEKTVGINSTVHTSEEISLESANFVSKQIVTKATEDISEIVNKTVARQLSSITDKVYSQMERKLTLEQARRGRR